MPAPHLTPEPDLETLLRSPRRPRVRLQAILYLLTAITTFAAGVAELVLDLEAKEASAVPREAGWLALELLEST